MRRTSKVLLWTVRIAAALVLMVIAAALLILPSEWFRDKVRVRIVNEVERASGGKVEIGSFRFHWRELRAEVAPFILRGTEPAGAHPLFRAELIQVDLKIISILKKDVDIRALLVDRPQINLLIDENGITNLPAPPVRRPSGPLLEPLIKLAIQQIHLREGELRYGDRRLPVNLYGERLNAQLKYNFAGPSYLGDLSFERMDVNAPPVLPISAGVQTQLELFANSMRIQSARLRTRTAQAEAAGTLEDFRHMRLNLSLNANGSLTELGKPLHLPEPHVGNVQFKGSLTFDAVQRLRVAGRLTGQGLAVRQGGVHIQNVAMAADVKYAPGQVNLTALRLDALDGRFDGMADIQDFRQFRVNGRVSELSIKALSQVAGIRGTTFAGIVSGPVEIAGEFGRNARDLIAAGRLDVKAGAEGVPIQGFVEATFNRRRGTLQLGNSFATLPSSRIDFKGTLGQRLDVILESRDLNDFVPVMAAVGESGSLPVKLLPGGSGRFEGTVTGPFASARTAGNLSLTNFQVRNQTVDSLNAKLDADRNGVRLDTFALGQQQLRMQGSADIALQNWKFVESNVVKATVTLKGAPLAKLLADAGQKLPVEGILNATASTEGPANNPRISARLDVENPKLYGESFDRIRAEIKYAGTGVEVISGVAEAGPSRVILSGAYEHPANDLRNGRLRFDLTTRDYTLQAVNAVRSSQPGLVGSFDIKGTGMVEIRKGELFPQTLNGTVDLRDVSVSGRSLGSISVEGITAGDQLTYKLAGTSRGSSITGSGSVRLSGAYPSTGQVNFTALSLSAVQDLLTTSGSSSPPAMEGVAEGRLTFSGPLKNPELITASLALPRLEISPSRRTLTADRVQQLSLRNSEPVLLEYSRKAIQVTKAHMVGRETDIEIDGTIALEAKANYDLRVTGHLNLEVLQDFHTDIVSAGVAQVSASIKGPLQNPAIGGRMDLKNASFNLTDLPNGIENATGTVIFDQQRATIQKLTAKTGGGDLTLSGFIGFGGGQTVYQLQARADRVRIRYPEGVSTTANAALSLTGTPERSLLAGTVTVLRAGFNPRTDVGGLLAASGEPIAPSPTANPFLRGMQFDVRVETTPNLQFQTSLTQDLQAEADLRLRGTAAKPALLGRIVVNQGEIQFFGNKYTINRGEIGFFNPIKLEPVLDMDLETRVRGVLVNITFSGTLGKLNVSYRSDPPLQSTEIIALLTVGRTPGSNSSLASGQTVTNRGFLAGSGNSLLGQAVAAPVSSRLQRFFGVSRLKIDPQLTGVNAVPQARLTIEQQISRDITLTYITNLSEANQQIVRLEWDISRNWSVVALREENGVFGVDFFFKKRLK